MNGVFNYLPILVICADLSFAEPFALVLAGGGAKGAYEVGVWKAMQEKGIAQNVRVISGTSVGALNAALFASVESEAQIESFWTNNVGSIVKNFNLSKVTKEFNAGVDAATEVRRKITEYRECRLAEEAARMGIPKDKLPFTVKCKIGLEVKRETAVLSLGEGLNFTTNKVRIIGSDSVSEGWIDPEGLRGALARNLPRDWGADSPLVYATALDKASCKTRVFKLNDEPFERKIDIIRATCAIPVVFDNVVIDGHAYVDGGWTNIGFVNVGGDNVPISPVVENHPEIKTIFVVYLDDSKGLAVDPLLGGDSIDESMYPDKKIVKIIPSVSLYSMIGALDFRVNTAEKLFQLGYDDAIRIIDALSN